MKKQLVANASINYNVRAKISDRLDIKAKPKTYFIRDSELLGFWIRVPAMNVDGATYIVNSKPRGSQKDKRLSIGKVSQYKAKDVREIARKWIHLIKEGIDPKQETRRLHGASQSLSDAFDQYVNDKVAAGKMRPATVKNYQDDKRSTLKSLMRHQINSLTDDIVLAWYRRVASNSPSAADKAYRELSAVCNYQVALGNIEKNPCKLVSSLGHRTSLKSKTSHLTIDELGRVVVGLPEFKVTSAYHRTIGNLWLFFVFTGMRKLSVHSLQWSQVKLRDSVHYETTKNGDSYHLPLIPLLNDLLEEQRAIVPESCPWVFPNKKLDGAMGNPKWVLEKLYAEADVDKTYRAHDLRRTFASIANLAGISYSDIKHLMVHKKSDITAQYIQTPPEKAGENYQKIAELVASETKISHTIDETGRAITHLATVDILRFLLFGKGRLASHPNRFDGDFLLGVSEEFYQDELSKKMDW